MWVFVVSSVAVTVGIWSLLILMLNTVKPSLEGSAALARFRGAVAVRTLVTVLPSVLMGVAPGSSVRVGVTSLMVSVVVSIRVASLLPREIVVVHIIMVVIRVAPVFSSLVISVGTGGRVIYGELEFRNCDGIIRLSEH